MEITIQGQIVLMDTEDAMRYIGIRLFISSHGYLKRGRFGNKEGYLHREIMGAPKNMVVDHISGDKLDNRKSNLRICTQAENAKNARLRSNNKSGVCGVHWTETRCKWVVQITTNGKTKSLGRFDSYDDAVAVRVAAEQKYHGQYAATNGVLGDG